VDGGGGEGGGLALVQRSGAGDVHGKGPRRARRPKLYGTILETRARGDFSWSSVIVQWDGSADLEALCPWMITPVPAPLALEPLEEPVAETASAGDADADLVAAGDAGKPTLSRKRARGRSNEVRLGMDSNDDWCSFCLSAEQMIAMCDGLCLRSFHLSCMTRAEERRFYEAREAEVATAAALAAAAQTASPGSKPPPAEEDQPWFCDDCLSCSHFCALCGVVGEDDVEVYKCRFSHCGRYFHLKCVRENAVAVGQDLSVTSKGPTFACPSHFCETCAGKVESGGSGKLEKAESASASHRPYALVRCVGFGCTPRACCRSFHRRCVPEEIKYLDPARAFCPDCAGRHTLRDSVPLRRREDRELPVPAAGDVPEDTPRVGTPAPDGSAVAGASPRVTGDPTRRSERGKLPPKSPTRSTFDGWLPPIVDGTSFDPISFLPSQLGGQGKDGGVQGGSPASASRGKAHSTSSPGHTQVEASIDDLKIIPAEIAADALSFDPSRIYGRIVQYTDDAVPVPGYILFEIIGKRFWHIGGHEKKKTACDAIVPEMKGAQMGVRVHTSVCVAPNNQVVLWSDIMERGIPPLKVNNRAAVRRPVVLQDGMTFTIYGTQYMYEAYDTEGGKQPTGYRSTRKLKMMPIPPRLFVSAPKEPAETVSEKDKIRVLVKKPLSVKERKAAQKLAAEAMSPKGDMTSPAKVTSQKKGLHTPQVQTMSELCNRVAALEKRVEVALGAGNRGPLTGISQSNLVQLYSEGKLQGQVEHMEQEVALVEKRHARGQVLVKRSRVNDAEMMALVRQRRMNARAAKAAAELAESAANPHLAVPPRRLSQPLTEFIQSAGKVLEPPKPRALKAHKLKPAATTADAAAAEGVAGAGGLGFGAMSAGFYPAAAMAAQGLGVVMPSFYAAAPGAHVSTSASAGPMNFFAGSQALSVAMSAALTRNPAMPIMYNQPLPPALQHQLLQHQFHQLQQSQQMESINRQIHQQQQKQDPLSQGNPLQHFQQQQLHQLQQLQHLQQIQQMQQLHEVELMRQQQEALLRQHQGQTPPNGGVPTPVSAETSQPTPPPPPPPPPPPLPLQQEQEQEQEQARQEQQPSQPQHQPPQQ